MEENKVMETEGNETVEEIKNSEDLTVIDLPPAETNEDDGAMIGVALLVGAGALIGVGVDKIVIPGIKKGKQAVDDFLAKRREKKEAREIEKLIKLGYRVSAEYEDFEELDEETETTEN